MVGFGLMVVRSRCLAAHQTFQTRKLAKSFVGLLAGCVYTASRKPPLYIS